MQLRLAPLATKVTGVGFKYSTSAVLASITVAGTFSTLIFSPSIISQQANNAFESFVNVIKASPLYYGIKKAGETLHQWGQTIVTSKDDFKEWLGKYLGPDGFKSGVVNIYEKLVDWVTIIYNWFKDRFLEFVGNIPKMVENWKKLRLSLFKWGTFLGGGGGSALWAMFGGFDNLGKLADLMGNSAVREAAEMFADLVDKNPDAFKDMGQDSMQEILERIAETPEDAKEIMEELKKEQAKMQELEEQKDSQLDQERIKEAFKQAKGSPQDEEQVLGHLTEKVLEGLSKSYFSDASPEIKAKEAIEKYMKEIEAKKEQKTKSGKAYKAVWDVLKEGDNEKTFKDELSKLAGKAFLKSDGKIESLRKEFGNIMENALTVVIPDNGDQSEAVDVRKIFKLAEQ